MAEAYKLILNQKSGLLSDLQSDTIFGHFCWRLKDAKGEDKLKEFLELYSNGDPVFTISNSFFERDGIIYLPNPIIPIKDDGEGKIKDEKIKSFLEYKDSKSKKYLPIEQFNAMLNGDESKLKTLMAEEEKQNQIYRKEGKYYKLKQPKYTEDLRTSVEISRESFSSKEDQLFSYAPQYVEEEIIDSKKGEFTKTNTVIFIKVLDDEKFGKDSFDCEIILKEVFNTGFGKKKSSGYGEFEVVSLERYTGFTEPEDSNGFITLSNYLPSEEDGITPENSYYDLKIKYGKFGEELALSENPFKRPIVFMTPGSCFRSNAEEEFYGRCTNSGEISNTFPEAIQNGIVFSLRMKIACPF